MRALTYKCARTNDARVCARVHAFARVHACTCEARVCACEARVCVRARVRAVCGCAVILIFGRADGGGGRRSWRRGCRRRRSRPPPT